MEAQGLYQSQVLDHLIHQTLIQKSPDLDVVLHLNVILKLLFELADQKKIPWVCAGYHAIRWDDPASQSAGLSKGSETLRDQAYLLYGLHEKKLSRLHLPCGSIPDRMLAKLTEETELSDYFSNHSGDLASKNRNLLNSEEELLLLQAVLPPNYKVAGTIRDLQGAVIGSHEGLYRYRYGQRKGLKIETENSENLCVLGFDFKHQALIVGSDQYLYQQEARLKNLNWLSSAFRTQTAVRGLKCKVGFAPGRELPQNVGALVTVFEGGRASLEFAQPLRGLSPGQTRCVYQKMRYWGGAVIDKLGPIPAP